MDIRNLKMEDVLRMVGQTPAFSIRCDICRIRPVLPNSTFCEVCTDLMEQRYADEINSQRRHDGTV